jgi:spore coat polysaccharide biosynthesis predicted glycosyltransferase SpsG
VTRPRALFRVDAGAIGLGHLDRCLALAAALRETGVASVFLGAGTADALQRAAAAGFTVETVAAARPWSHDDAEMTAAVARRCGAEIAVVDSEVAGAGYLGALRGSGLFVVAIDDLAMHAFPCQLVVNNNADAEDLPYATSSGDTQFLLGPRYALLGPEFRALPARPAEPAGMPTVFVAMGGYDRLDLMPRLVTELGRLPTSFAMRVVVGPFSTNLADVKRAAADAGRPVHVAHAPTEMAPLMSDATLAVTAAGQTLYRLARAGCPAVAVEAAGNQRGQLAALARAGVLRAVPLGPGGDVSGVVAEAHALLRSPNDRARMRAAGQALVDGAGATRVAEAMLSGAAREGAAR